MSTLSIGITGLTAAQIGLTTTSHNIANTSTPGYNRQVIVQGTNTPILTGAGFVGQGTHVQTIKRVYDQFLSQQVLSAQTSASEMDGYLKQINQINNLFADNTSGLSPALSEFFKGLQETAANPASIPARQSALSAAQSLVARVQAIDQRMTEVRDGVNAQITSEVASINSFAKQIGAINERILLSRAGGINQEPNDLLDQRDQLIAELNKSIKVSTVTQSDGSYNVFVGNGQTLVMGTESYTLKAIPSADDPGRIVVGMQMPGGGVVEMPESQMSGGTLGGLLSFRSASLDSAQNALGRIAISLAININDQHRLGQDLTGALGGNFFNVASPVVYPNTLNTSGAQISAAFSATAVADLTTSDYRLTYSAANTFTLTRISDGTSWTGTGATPTAALTSVMAAAPGQGFTLNLTGTPNIGESFKIEPTHAGAYGMGVAIVDPRNIAAAAPIRSAATMSNTGTGTISAGTVNPPPPTNPALQHQVSITFDNPPTTFDVYDITAGASLATNVAYTAGSDISYNGWTVKISGAPAAGDIFTVAQNANGVSDNRNAVLLAGLQTATNMIGGTASYQSAYAQIVSEIGNKTRQVETVGEAQQNLVEQTQAERERMSGVNLDEEAANLLRYQQAYQASAKVIQIAGKLFDDLLAVTN